MAVKGSIAWMAAAQTSSFVLQFASSVVLARLLTPREMGVFAVAIAIVGALSIVQAFGLQSMIIRERDLTERVEVGAFTGNAIISIFLSGLIAGVAFVGGRFLEDDGVRRVLLVLALSPVLAIPGFLPAAQLEREGRFKLISIVNMAKGLALSVCTIIFALFGLKYMSIAYAQVISQAFGVVLFCIAGRQHFRIRFGLYDIGAIARFGFQMLAVSGVADVSRRLSDIVLAKMLGLPALGLYNRSSGLNSLLWDRIHLVLGRVLFVDFAAHTRAGHSLRDKYLTAVEMITALLWPAFAGLAVLAGPFILRVYGARWAPAAEPLALLAIASIIQVSITMTWEVFVACGELRTQTRIEFIRAGLSLAMFAAGCAISLPAAAGSRIADSLLAVFLYRGHLQRMTDTTLADFLPIYLRSGLLTGLAILPASILMIAYRGSPATPLGFAIATIPAGGALWALGLVLLKHRLLAEALAWVRRHEAPPETAPT